MPAIPKLYIEAFFIFEICHLSISLLLYNDPFTEGI